MTGAGWPEPTDWVKRLQAICDERGERYLAATGQRNREPGSYTDNDLRIETLCLLEAAGVLSAVASALNELPAFRDNPATVALNDLTIALNDLAAGGAPVLLQRGERQSEAAPVEPDIIIAYATLSVRLLKTVHSFTDRAARREVAAILAKSGVRGRKGSLLSASTLQDWQDTYAEFPADHPAKVAIERKWGEWIAHPDWQSGQSLKASKAWIAELASRPIFRNKANRTRA